MYNIDQNPNNWMSWFWSTVTVLMWKRGKIFSVVFCHNSNGARVDTRIRFCVFKCKENNVDVLLANMKFSIIKREKLLSSVLLLSACQITIHHGLQRCIILLIYISFFFSLLLPAAWRRRTNEQMLGRCDKSPQRHSENDRQQTIEGVFGFLWAVVSFSRKFVSVLQKLFGHSREFSQFIGMQGMCFFVFFLDGNWNLVLPSLIPQFFLLLSTFKKAFQFESCLWQLSDLMWSPTLSFFLSFFFLLLSPRALLWRAAAE